MILDSLHSRRSTRKRRPQASRNDIKSMVPDFL